MFDLSIQTKTYLVFGIMIGCFVILYPKIFHPMVLHLFGFNSPAQELDDGLMHPRERAMRMGQRDTHHPHSRPHPGMRAERQGVKEASRGAGIMGMVLPVYAICIVLYLVYTLAKVFGNNNNNNDASKEVKQKPRASNDPLMREHFNNFDYCPGQENFTMRSNPEESDDDDPSTRDETVEQWLKQPGSQNNGKKNSRTRPPRARSSYTSEALRMKTLPSDLERLLKKVDDKNISEREMRELRVRLEETERQMTQLLEAMRTAEEEEIPQSDENDGSSPQGNPPKRVNPTPAGNSNKAFKLPHSKVKTNGKTCKQPVAPIVQSKDEDAVNETDEDLEVVTASEGEEPNEAVMNSKTYHRTSPAKNKYSTHTKPEESDDDEEIECSTSEIRERKIKT